MKSVLMMVSANVRKRKAQSLLILSTIMMASFLLTTAVGVLDNLNSPFEQMYEGQNGSHITMQLPPGFHDPDQIVGWWETQDNVLGVQRFPYLLVNDKIGHNDVTKSMGGLMITEHPGLALTQDRLVIVDGVEKSGPDVGEVWVPTGYAYAWGIEVNDVLEITINGVGQAMSVSAIVVDPQFSIGMMNPIRVWVKEGTLALSKDSPDKGLLIAVRLSDHLQQYLLWPDFEAALGTPFLGFLFDYAFIGYSYSMVESIIGAIMLLFSGIIILVSVCVIYFTISNAIITDFKTIGILKTQGFSAVQVKKLYVLQYMLLALVAIPLGILTSSPVTGAVLSQMVRSLGLSRLDASLTLPATVTVVTIGAVVLAATHVSARRAGLIKPADAIRNKPPASKGVGNRHLGLTRISVLPVSLLLALKSTQSEKRHSILMVAATAIMAFVVVFSVEFFVVVFVYVPPLFGGRSPDFLGGGPQCFWGDIPSLFTGISPNFLGGYPLSFWGDLILLDILTILSKIGSIYITLVIARPLPVLIWRNSRVIRSWLHKLSMAFLIWFLEKPKMSAYSW